MTVVQENPSDAGQIAADELHEAISRAVGVMKIKVAPIAASEVVVRQG